MGKYGEMAKEKYIWLKRKWVILAISFLLAKKIIILEGA